MVLQAAPITQAIRKAGQTRYRGGVVTQDGQGGDVQKSVENGARWALHGHLYSANGLVQLAVNRSCVCSPPWTYTLTFPLRTTLNAACQPALSSALGNGHARLAKLIRACLAV